jgi:prefoldin subunit 5
MAKEPINKKLDPEVTRIILELDLLKSQADSFRNALDSVQHRIADLEKTNS